jgi:hypothetical protein
VNNRFGLSISLKQRCLFGPALHHLIPDAYPRAELFPYAICRVLTGCRYLYEYRYAAPSRRWPQVHPPV